MKSLRIVCSKLQRHVLRSRKPDMRSVPFLAALAVLVLGCWMTVAAGKKPGSGNQPVPGMAEFVAGNIVSNGPVLASWVDNDIGNSGWETLIGELANGESLTISGDAGAFLANLEDALGNVLPPPPMSDFDTAAGTVTFYDASWSLRLDFDRAPPNRVQLKIQWFNGENDEGEFHSFDVGLPNPELLPADFGEVTGHADGTELGPGEQPSLRDATVEYANDPFQVRGNLLTGKGKKTQKFVYSHYYEVDGVTPQDGTSSCVILINVP